MLICTQSFGQNTSALEFGHSPTTSTKKTVEYIRHHHEETSKHILIFSILDKDIPIVLFKEFNPENKISLKFFIPPGKSVLPVPLFYGYTLPGGQFVATNLAFSNPILLLLKLQIALVMPHKNLKAATSQTLKWLGSRKL